MKSQRRDWTYGVLGIVMMAALGVGGAWAAQIAGGAKGTAGTQSQQGRATSTPYAGDLSIFEYPDRDRKLQIDRVMSLLGIRAGKSVVDLGAGSGWFTVRAARRVGPSGTVYAEDINAKAIEAIKVRARKEKLENVKTILGTPDDPMLPPGSTDAVLMLKVYHEIARPVPVMVKVRAALRPGGRVGIIDRKGNGTDHGLDAGIVIREMGEAGYSLLKTYDFTKADGQDYFMIFVVKPAEK